MDVAQKVRQKFTTVRKELNDSLIERHDEIDMVLTALVAGEHPLLVGPPGVAKSMLLSGIAQWFGVDYFSALITKFTTPEEIFGPVSLMGLKEDKFRRVTNGKLPQAQMSFIDEVFKGSSAILNSLLTILNERKYDAGEGMQTVPLKLCVGASNEWPGDNDQGKELNALFDRFLLRKTVKPIATTDGRRKLLWGGNHDLKLTEQIDPAELELATEEAKKLPWSEKAKKDLETIIQELSAEGIRPGDRRQFKAVKVAQAYAWLLGANEVTSDHLEILTHVLWEDPIEQPAKVAQVISKTSNPMHFIINGFLKEAHDISAATKIGDIAEASAAVSKLSEITNKLKGLPDNAKVKAARAEVAKIKQTIRAAAMPKEDSED